MITEHCSTKKQIKVIKLKNVKIKDLQEGTLVMMKYVVNACLYEQPRESLTDDHKCHLNLFIQF